MHIPVNLKLLMFSGGLDSTYLLWHLLTHKRLRGDVIHVHHVHLINDREKMYWPQRKACAQVLKYLKKHDFDFEYTESFFDFSNFSSIGVDNDILLVVAQKLCHNFDLVDSIDILFGWIQHDVERIFVCERAKREVYPKLWSALINSIDDPIQRSKINMDIKYPLIDLQVTKQSMLDEMPEKLGKLAWSCRQPKFNKWMPWKYKPCGMCHACKARSKGEL